MDFKAYAEYSATENEWFPSVPRGWDVRKIKFSFASKSGAIKTGPFGSQLKSEEMNSDEIKVYNQKNVIRKDLDVGDEYISLEKFEELKAFEVFDGDLLVSTRGTIGKCLQVNSGSEKGILHPCLMRIQFDQNETLNEYFVYLLEGSGLLLDQLNISSNSTTLEVIYSDTLKNLYAPLPTTKEQQKIATFLDYKTQQIDQLIEKKKALIEKLEEKRIAVITQAVTKGLDKNAKLKHSGVDWLGDVPEHWDVEKLKFHIEVKGGGTPSTDNYEYWNGDIPWVSPKDMKSETITTTQDYITEVGLERSATSLIEEGAVLIVVRSGILKHSIPVAINVVPVSLNQDMKALSVNTKILISEYLAAFIYGLQEHLLVLWSKPGCTVESIEYDWMMNTAITIPPISEQQEILAYINKEKDYIDGLSQKANRAIENLNEYRAALITSAVTGKIDVREVEIPKEVA